MSIALLLRDDEHAQQRLVPVATQAIFAARWLPGALGLGLEWVELMETGFDVTAQNVGALTHELERLRAWMASRGEEYEIGRLDALLHELAAIRFDRGASAFLG